MSQVLAQGYCHSLWWYNCHVSLRSSVATVGRTRIFTGIWGKNGNYFVWNLSQNVFWFLEIYQIKYCFLLILMIFMLFLPETNESKIRGKSSYRFYVDSFLRQWSFFQGEERLVKHFQYVAWPDHGTPKSTTEMLDFIRTIRSKQHRNDGPLICHCS